MLKINNKTNLLTRSKTKKYPTRTLSKIDKIILHHSATTSGSAEAFARYHVDTLGWAGIGYCFVINKDGSIDQTNELTSISNHTAGQNTSGIGICFVGNFDIETPTTAQELSGQLLITYLRGILNKKIPVFGHCDFSTKTCPGKLFNLNKFKSL